MPELVQEVCGARVGAVALAKDGPEFVVRIFARHPDCPALVQALPDCPAFRGAADQLILRAATAAQAARPGRDPGRSAGTAELISHLAAASGGRIPEALLPERPLGRVHGVDGAAVTAHSRAAQVRARQAELEAGA